MALLEMKAVARRYERGAQTVHALRGIDLSIAKGEFVSVVGPSGSGKSTLLNIIGCLDSPTEGDVVYNGTRLGSMSDDALADYRKNHIAFIFQQFNLIPVLTVRENVELPLVIGKRWTRPRMREMAMAMLSAVELGDMADRYPRELSGGQEQRVAVARALVKQPLVVLADEPTANLDSATAENVISIMEKLNRERDTTFIFSTHDARMEQHATRVVTLHDGRIGSDRKKGG
jgi:putative ABC transport system ATP-binding protein